MKDPAGIPFNRRSISPDLNRYDYPSAKISAKTHAVVINGNYAKRVPRLVFAGVNSFHMHALENRQGKFHAGVGVVNCLNHVALNDIDGKFG